MPAIKKSTRESLPHNKLARKAQLAAARKQRKIEAGPKKRSQKSDRSERDIVSTSSSAARQVAISESVTVSSNDILCGKTRTEYKKEAFERLSAESSRLSVASCQM